jgi:hypothetical protein
MSSRGKKKTTMAKLSRESRLRERRLEKKARKDARTHTPLHLQEVEMPRADEDQLEDAGAPDAAAGR